LIGSVESSSDTRSTLLLFSPPALIESDPNPVRPPETQFPAARARVGRIASMESPMSLSPHAWLGCRRDARDPRDHRFVPAPSTLAALPAAVDLRAHCPPVMDQGELGSCTAHGITGALRYAADQARASRT
jgi:C1A family cysteine protease